MRELAGLAGQGADAARDRTWRDAALQLLEASFAADDVPEIGHFLARAEMARQAVLRGGSIGDRARIESLVGWNFMNLGRYRDARATLLGAIELSRAAAQPTAALYVDLAESDLMLADNPAALVELRQAELELHTPGGRADRTPRFHEIAAKVYLRCGLLEQVPAHLAALEGLESPSDPVAHAFDVLQRVNFQLATQEFEKAIELTGGELERGALLDDRTRAQLLVRHGVARSESARGTLADGGARATLERALAEPKITPGDATTAELVLADVALRAARLDDAAARLDAAAARLEARRAGSGPAPRPDEWALYEAERGRLAIERDEPRPALEVRRDRLRAALEDVLKVWETGPARVGGFGFLCFGTQRFVVSELMRLEMAIDRGEPGVVQALAVLMRAQGVGRLARASGIGPIDLARVIDALLPIGTGLCVYLPSMDRSHLFVVDAGKAEHFPLAGDDALEAAVLALAIELQSPPASTTDAARRRSRIEARASELTRLVLPPAARARLATWTGLYVCGADLVGDLPVESLLLEDDRELGLALALGYLPSLPSAVWLAERAASRPQSSAGLDLVLVSEPDLSGASPASASTRSAPLGLSDDEIKALLGAFDPARTRAFRHAAAVPSVLGSDVVRDARLLAILAHGTFRPELEHAAGLSLTPENGGDGVVSTALVERTRAPAFVALYACGSARGQVRMGDDAGTHLGGAFLAAGADSVLVSRGDVRLRATLELARVLHESLRAGNSPAEALRRARVALASNPATSDPSYRALLRIDGLALRPVFPRSVTPHPEPEARVQAPAVRIAAALAVLLTSAALLPRRRASRPA